MQQQLHIEGKRTAEEKQEAAQLLLAALMFAVVFVWLVVSAVQDAKRAEVCNTEPEKCEERKPST